MSELGASFGLMGLFCRHKALRDTCWIATPGADAGLRLASNPAPVDFAQSGRFLGDLRQQQVDGGQSLGFVQKRHMATVGHDGRNHAGVARGHFIKGLGGKKV